MIAVFLEMDTARGQPRPRARAVKKGKNAFAQVYMPAWYAVQVDGLRSRLASVLPKEGGLPNVAMTFYCKRPLNYRRKADPEGIMFPRTQSGGDIDKLAATILDASCPPKKAEQPTLDAGYACKDDRDFHLVLVQKVWAEKVPGAIGVALFYWTDEEEIPSPHQLKYRPPTKI